MMDSNRWISDLNEIKTALPAPMIRMLLERDKETGQPDPYGYRKVHVIHNQSDWLWSSF